MAAKHTSDEMSSTESCTCERLSSAKSPWCGANCFVAVTGASRGFGQAFCIELVTSMSSGEDHAASLNILLMARDVNALRITESKMNASKPSNSPMKLNIVVSTSSLDMSNANEKVLREELEPLFHLSLELSRRDTNERQWNMLVHNAATLGDVQSRTDERFNIEALDTYYRMNLTAPMILTSLFLQHFAPANQPFHHPVTIVNISSLAAVQPFSCMSDYCVGKAARQMYLKCLCIDRPSIAVFNYSPGPLDTDMFKQILEEHGDDKTRQAFTQIKVDGRIVDPLESARVCVGWLKKQIPITGKTTGEGCVPKLSYCSVHQEKYSDVWTGPRLDYFDAVREVK